MNAHLDLGLRPNEARLNLTYDGKNGDLPEPVPFYASDAELKDWAREALIGNAIPGFTVRGRVDLAAYVVDRFPANAQVPYNRIFLRPSTPFG
jgi:hypothetical protein